MVEGVHLYHPSRCEALEVGHRQPSGRVEPGASGLDSDDEARLLAEVRDHWNFVVVHSGYAHYPAPGAAREDHRPWGDLKPEPRNLRQRDRAAMLLVDQNTAGLVEREQVDRHAEVGVATRDCGDHEL